jgi:hypothetical protein
MQHVVVILIFKGKGIQEEETRKYALLRRPDPSVKIYHNMLRNISEEGRIFF